LIWLRHNSLSMVIDNLIYINAVLFAMMLGYYILNSKIQITNDKSSSKFKKF